MRAATALSQLPPHIAAGAEIEYVKYRVHFAEKMANLARLAKKHIRRVDSMSTQRKQQTKNIYRARSSWRLERIARVLT